MWDHFFTGLFAIIGWELGGVVVRLIRNRRSK
jgi:hypothetical protein